MKDELTIIYYTANYLEKENPVFLKNTERQLVKAIGDIPLIVISQKPTSRFEGYEGNYTNLVAGKDFELHRPGRHHLNIYKQILVGAKASKTMCVATAEDDILYSKEHFHSRLPKFDTFLYDMNKLSIFTWTKPPLYSFRHNRKVVNQLIAPAKMLVEAMEERFQRLVTLSAQGVDEERVLKYWGDPGRYEKHLGVTERKSDTFMSTNPSIVFTHPKAYGYEFNHGKKKRLGDLRIIEIPRWGTAEEVLKSYYENWETKD